MRFIIKKSLSLFFFLIIVYANSNDTVFDYSENKIGYLLDLMEKGDIRSGFNSLNRIILNGDLESGDIDSVAKICARIFLPQDINTSSFSDTIFFSEDSDISIPFAIKCEGSLPASEFFKIISDSSSEYDKALPSILFSFKFLFKDRFPFKIPFLKEAYFPQLKMCLRDDLKGDVLKEILWVPGMPDYNAEISIVVDCGGKSESLDEYMYNIVSDRYDVVRKSDDLKEFGAISLRCYINSAFSNVPGRFFAFIGFDRLITQADSTVAVSRLAKKGFVARYLIAAKSSKAIEPQTEYLVSQILDLFSKVQF